MDKNKKTHLIDEFTPDTLMDSLVTVFSFLIEQNQNKVNPEITNPCAQVFVESWKNDWISVGQYIKRLRSWLFCSYECFVAAICLIRRLEKSNSIPPITQLTFHRILHVCLVIAIKLSEDEMLRNVDFAKVGCMELEQLNRAEIQVFIALNFSCFISQQEFQDCLQDLAQLESTLITPNGKKIFSSTTTTTTTTTLTDLININKEYQKYDLNQSSAWQFSFFGIKSSSLSWAIFSGPSGKKKSILKAKSSASMGFEE